MSVAIRAEPLAREAFAAFGDVLETVGEPDKIINQGLCGRWHDLAKLDVTDGRVGLSLFKAELRSLPYSLDMMERHPGRLPGLFADEPGPVPGRGRTR